MSLRQWFKETNAKSNDVLRFGQEDIKEDRLFIELIPQAAIPYRGESTKNQSLISISEGIFGIAKSIGMRNMLKLASIGTRLEEIFKEGTDKALNAELYTNQPIDQCVKLISHDTLLMRFFDKYWESSEFKRVFSYRPIQLILETDNPNEELTKRFTFVDLQTPTPLDLSPIEKIKDIQRARLELKYHRLLEEYDLLVPAFKTLMADIEEISGGDDSAKANLLAEILDLANNTLKNPEIHNELVGLIRDLFHEPIPMIQALMGMYLPEELKKAESNLQHILQVCRLTRDHYGKMIDALSDMKILSNAYRFHWCPFHAQDPFYSLSIIPTTRFAGTCPQCGQQLSSIGWSMINSDLFYFMRHKDGLMTIAIAWFAQKNGWEWKSNLHLDGQEIDLQLRKQKTIVYIETKSLMFDNDYSALRRKILEELHKFEKKRAIIKSEPDSKYLWLFILNLPGDLLATLKLRSDADVSIISVEDFKDCLNKTGQT